MRIAPKLSLDLVVNVVILITCAALGAALVQRQLGFFPGLGGGAAKLIKAGDTAEPIAGVSYAGMRATVLLHVRSSCQYCTQSMAFYRRVREVTRQIPQVQFVVVGVEPAETLQRYLADNGVTADRVVSAPTAPQPTPTVVLVDGSGVVREAWLGLQNSEGERQVLQQIQGSGALASAGH